MSGFNFKVRKHSSGRPTIVPDGIYVAAKLPAKDVVALDRIAAARRVNRSALIRDFVDAGVRRYIANGELA